MGVVCVRACVCVVLWTPEDLFLPITPDLHLLLHPLSSGHPAVHFFPSHLIHVFLHRCFTPPICPPNLFSHLCSLLKLLISYYASVFILLLVFSAQFSFHIAVSTLITEQQITVHHSYSLHRGGKKEPAKKREITFVQTELC